MMRIELFCLAEAIEYIFDLELMYGSTEDRRVRICSHSCFAHSVIVAEIQEEEEGDRDQNDCGQRWGVCMLTSIQY